jgi:uncharacterized protein with HEPN domain
LVHGYLEVNMDIVWNVIVKYLPELKRAITSMIQKLENRDELPPDSDNEI